MIHCAAIFHASLQCHLIFGGVTFPVANLPPGTVARKDKMAERAPAPWRVFSSLSLARAIATFSRVPVFRLFGRIFGSCSCCASRSHDYFFFCRFGTHFGCARVTVFGCVRKTRWRRRRVLCDIVCVYVFFFRRRRLVLQLFHNKRDNKRARDGDRKGTTAEFLVVATEKSLSVL